MKLDIFTAANRNTKFWDAGTITWDEILGWMENPADKKQAGNYVLGRFKSKRRTKATLIDRCAITLDADSADEDFVGSVMENVPGRALVHTTYSSTPDSLRYRVIIPMARRVDPEQYGKCAAVLMEHIGKEYFDPGSVQGERYMFKPGTQDPEWFHWQEINPGADPMYPDSLLEQYSPEETTIAPPKVSKRKRDPYELEGTVGIFNRCYRDLDELVRVYDLPYEREAADRYRLVGAGGASGMGPIEDAEGLYYSHHSHDPAYGQTCNAFDLVRLHRFGDQDSSEDLKKPVIRRKSHQMMLDLAVQDPKVLAETVGSDFSQDMEDLADTLEGDQWRTKLTRNSKTAKVKDEVHNWDLITKNDPVFSVIFRNELTFSTEISGDLPWRKLERGRETFNTADHSQLMFYLEREYGFRPAKYLVEDLVRNVAEQHIRNPVRDYLLSLKWDKVPRLETSLPGVKDTKYTRMVARKSLVAAVARMLVPGCKWDHMLVIYGKEGLGKTFWIDKMARGWSAPLGRLGDKDTLLSLQRSWIVTSDEGHSLKKADFDAQKEFLTRTEDVFRLPYERETQAHKRHCVIWGTTNDEVFLRRQEGNRRFLIVEAEEQIDFDSLTDDYVDQVWAEAVDMFYHGEKLYLDKDEAEMAALEREPFIEEDAQEGVITRYLDMKVPANWNHMSPDSRKMWIVNREDGFEKEGVFQQDRVCSLQLWVEAFGQDIGKHRRMDLLEITNIMKRQKDWVRIPGRHRMPGYGPQMIFERRSESTDNMEDLI